MHVEHKMAVVFVVVLVLFTSGACNAVSLTCPAAVDGIPYRLTCSGGYTSWSWKVFWEVYDPEKADHKVVSECRAEGSECTKGLTGYSATFSFFRPSITFSSDLLIDIINPSHQNQIVTCRVEDGVKEKCTLNVITGTENASCQAMPFLKPGVLITCTALFVPSDMRIECHLFYFSDNTSLQNYTVIKGFKYLKNIESDQSNSHSCSITHFPNVSGTYSYRAEVFYERDNLAWAASRLFEFNNVVTIPHPNVHLETCPDRNKNVVKFICSAHGYQATPHFKWYVGNSQVTTDFTPEVFTDPSNYPRQLSYKMKFPLSLGTLSKETQVSCEVTSGSVTRQENISISDIMLGNKALSPDPLMFTLENEPVCEIVTIAENESSTITCHYTSEDKSERILTVQCWSQENQTFVEISTLYPSQISSVAFSIFGISLFNKSECYCMATYENRSVRSWSSITVSIYTAPKAVDENEPMYLRITLPTLVIILFIIVFSLLCILYRKRKWTFSRAQDDRLQYSNQEDRFQNTSQEDRSENTVPPYQFTASNSIYQGSLSNSSTTSGRSSSPSRTGLAARKTSVIEEENYSMPDL